MAVFDFVFESERLDSGNLQQGDILSRTAELAATIEEAHSYYARADDYHYFMVLTQSCDLVRRGGRAKAPYITLAAVRPLSIAIDRLLAKYEEVIDGFPLRVCRSENELRVRQYLERLLHNTEQNFFFIRKEEKRGFDQDYCVYLELSIALRIDHYDACLGAKIAQLKDVFQAKVGWLTGNLYSRVGTPDFEDQLADPKTYKSEFFEEVMYNRTVWMSAEQIRDIKRLARQHNPLTEDEASEIIGKIKSKVEYLAERIAGQLRQNKLLSDDVKDAEAKVKNMLISDRVFKRHFSE